MGSHYRGGAIRPDGFGVSMLPTNSYWARKERAQRRASGAKLCAIVLVIGGLFALSALAGHGVI